MFPFQTWQLFILFQTQDEFFLSFVFSFSLFHFSLFLFSLIFSLHSFSFFSRNSPEEREKKDENVIINCVHTEMKRITKKNVSFFLFINSLVLRLIWDSNSFLSKFLPLLFFSLPLSHNFFPSQSLTANKGNGVEVKEWGEWEFLCKKNPDKERKKWVTRYEWIGSVLVRNWVFDSLFPSFTPSLFLFNFFLVFLPLSPPFWFLLLFNFLSEKILANSALRSWMILSL